MNVLNKTRKEGFGTYWPHYSSLPMKHCKAKTTNTLAPKQTMGERVIMQLKLMLVQEKHLKLSQQFFQLILVYF